MFKESVKKFLLIILALSFSNNFLLSMEDGRGFEGLYYDHEFKKLRFLSLTVDGGVYQVRNIPVDVCFVCGIGSIFRFSKSTICLSCLSVLKCEKCGLAINHVCSPARRFGKSNQREMKEFVYSEGIDDDKKFIKYIIPTESGPKLCFAIPTCDSMHRNPVLVDYEDAEQEFSDMLSS